jgi:Tol biopolymer transport system component
MAFLLALSMVPLMLLSSAPAQAAYPGRNGSIVFARAPLHGAQSDIWKMDRHGGSERRLTVGAGDERDPAWAPDGSRIIFTRYSSSGGFNLIIEKADGSSSHFFIGGGGTDVHPTWSPSGTDIAWAHDPSGPFQFQIVVSDLTQHFKNLRPPRARDAREPAWSPTGPRIAALLDGYSNGDGTTRTELFTMRPRGHEFQRIVRLTHTSASEYQPDWSPDGERIVFIRVHDNDEDAVRPGDIFVMDADGGSSSRLTHTPTDETSAAFSPNGKRIVFARCCYGQSQTSEIFSMRADGTHVVRLTQNEVDDLSPDWQPGVQR